MAANIGLFLLILSLLIWVLRYRSLPKGPQVLGWFLLANLLIQLTAQAFWVRKMNNLPLLHLNTILEFIFISYFFKVVYLGQEWFRRYYSYILIGICVLLGLNSVFFESIFDFNTHAKILVQICLIGFVLIYFFDAFGKVDFTENIPQSISLICFGILLYNAGSLFIFMFGQISIAKEIVESYRLIWMVNGILSTLLQFIFLIAFVKFAWGRRPNLSVGKLPVAGSRFAP